VHAKTADAALLYGTRDSYSWILIHVVTIRNRVQGAFLWLRTPLTLSCAWIHVSTAACSNNAIPILLM
jgi:hypothetical protein